MTQLLSAIFVKLPAKVLDAIARAQGVLGPLALLLLVLLGVHGAADLLDDILFAVVDLVDRGVDGVVRNLLGWLGDAGLLQPATAASWSDSAALLLDIDRKEALAVVLALLAELLLDVAVLLWCLPGALDDKAETLPSPFEFQSTSERVKAAHALVSRRAPGTLRAVSVVLAFALGAFALGRFVAGEVALLLASPLLGPEAAGLAPSISVLFAGVATYLVLPLALRRANARARSLPTGRPWRALVWPAAVLVLLAAALVTGAPGQALMSLAGGGA